MNIERFAVKYSISHEPESLTEYYQMAVGSQRFFDKNVSVAEYEIFRVRMLLSVLLSKAHQRVVSLKHFGGFLTVEP